MKMSPEAQASLIRWAGQAALLSADKKAGKKSKKTFSERFAEDFETNYKNMRQIIERADTEPAAQQ
jgi:hypothetical protein